MDWIPIEASPAPLTDLQKRISALLYKGMPVQLIARQLRIGLDRATDEIYEIRKREAIMAGKLTNQQRAAIYQAWKDGVPQKELAGQYGVSIPAVSQLVSKLSKAENEIREAPAAPAAEPTTTTAAAETENAEEISKNAEPEKLPDFVWNAIDDQICALNLEIETREQRIAELQGEIAEREAKKEQLRAWLEAHT